MKQFYFNCCRIAGVLSLVLLSSPALAQLPISQDNASNYASGEWVYGSNKGAGFTVWQIWTQGSGGFAGHFLGNSVNDGFGDVNTSGQAFGMYGNPPTGNPEAVTFRYFRGTGSIADPGDGRSSLLPGQVFSIDIAAAYRNGYKGIDIVTDDSQTLVNFGIDGNTYRFDGADVGTTYAYDQTSVFKIEAYQLTESTYKVSVTRNGITLNTAEKTGVIGGFKLYCSSTEDSNSLNNLYFNNLLVERRCPNVTTWNGSGWDNGAPDLTKRAVVASGTLTLDQDLDMCTLYVTGTAAVVVPTGFNLTVANEVNVASTASLTVENNANLIQIDNVQNTGNITVHRNSSPIMRLDYTLWSSPVTGQNLFGFSPETLPNRFYTYNSSTSLFSAVPDLGPDSETIFEKGHGYLIRIANNHPTTPTVWPGVFQGVPNSGTVSVPLYTSNDTAYRFNMVGNPYPSDISIERFINRNINVITGQLWFWRKTNNPDSASYCTVTASGDYIGNSDLEDSENFDPQGVISAGQGFFVKASSSSPGNIVFNNSLREADTNDRFFRSAMNGDNGMPEINRFWLNVSKNGEFYGQMLVNYRTGATMGIDYGIDGTAMDNDGALSLYSLAEGKKLAIQGRSLPFTTEDIVPLGLRANEAGTISIVLDKTDGLFTTQDIYIKDNLLGITHNIKDGPYEFATEAGIFSDRFEVVYAETLSNNTPSFDPKSLIVYKQGDVININSGNTAMKSVAIYDIRGRLLYSANDINAAKTSITTLQPEKQMLIVRVTIADGIKTDKKIIY